VKRWLSSLTNRIFLSSALVAVAVLGTAILVVNRMVSAQAERDLERSLDEAGALVEQYSSMLVRNLAQQARLVADLPKLKAAVAVDHLPTVQPLAADYRRQIDAALFVVLNRSGRVLAAEAPEPLPAAILGAIRARAQTDDGGVLYWSRPDAVLPIVTVPIWIDPRAPDLLGTLAVGVALDARLAGQVKLITDSDVAFVAGGRVRASTLPRDADAAIEALLDRAEPAPILVGGEEYVSRVRPLGARAAAAADGSGDAPALVILRSRTARLRLLRQLHTALAATGAVALLLATLLSYAVARTMTRPIEAITATMREMAATGDLTRRIELPPGGLLYDEDAHVLASTFNAMTGSIARFQREAAQRQRLLALGRLSTVVAHEIRNPLTIIKTALRVLRRECREPHPGAAAVADIDGEIERLNRLVNEVLDFARPMRFEVAPARLSEICRSAAAAAEAAADAGGPPCELALDPAADDIVTDAERLRQALVNVLLNARQAVAPAWAAAAGEPLAAAGSPEPPAGRARAEELAVRLATRRTGDDRVQIVVRDRGPGIAPEHLPHIFDPYFTTRRTGTGIGLAIARNIVEGLGGTIAADSRPGAGTEMRIELPRVASPGEAGTRP
jgi:signal transduction histidine kinase